MESFKAACCIIAFAATFVNGLSNSSIGSGGFDIAVLGQSGKIVITDKATNKAIMHVNPDRIAEITDDGVTEASGHSIESFASTDFTFSSVTTGTRYGMNTSTITFSTTLTGKATGLLDVEMIVFHQAGTITVDSGEKINVAVGSVKFNIDITGWKFCGGGVETCTKSGANQVGKFIDFTMEIKGKQDKTAIPEKASKQKGDKGAETYDFDGAVFTVSKMVQVDSIWKNMTANYPKVEQKGKKTLFTFRLPKFTTRVHYDPVLGSDVESSAAILNAGFINILITVFSLIVVGRYA